ncbi:hypothetical protein [Lagierella sp.]|uniref:hypothetical protein n=1 Tax=Lagierella sp. TaxID=2849657 RepID=UPI0026284D0B|nr:hypothetical protein [Lagierella sp.]
MEKLRRFVIFGIIVLYFVLYFLKIPVPKYTFTVILAIVLLNHGYEEYKIYKRDGEKVHLIIPIGNLILLLFALFLWIKNFI